MAWLGDLTPWRADWPAQGPDGWVPLQLRGVALRGLLAAGSRLRDADLCHADLSWADLREADLRGARLAQADLTLADLRDADLRQADLSGADLSGADLRGANLEGADLGGAALDWARYSGPAWPLMGDRAGADGALGADGRVAGHAAADGEPAVALGRYQRAMQHASAGRLELAERDLRAALRWVPESDIVRYQLGALALQRGDEETAQRWWRQALEQCPQPDRARLDLALLTARRDPTAALALLDGQPFAWADAVVSAWRSGGLQAAVQLVEARIGPTAATQWLQRLPPPQSAATREPADEAGERADLERLLADPRQPAWLWHGCIARALAIGDMALAQRADQRLRAVAPDQRLWSLGLQQLDMTSEAFAALVRTRRAALGRIQSLQWVALGVHGPTARLVCEAGTFYAKRYHGATRPAGSVAYTHRICRDLAARARWGEEVSIPVALADAHGDDVLVLGDDLLALYPAVDGHPRNDDGWTVADGVAAGGMLARLHLLASGLQAAGRPAGGVRTGTRILRSRDPAQAWLAALQRDPVCAVRLDRDGWGARLLPLIDATARRLQPLWQGCPRGLVHGDAGGGNLLWRSSGQLAGVVDWDLADADVWVWDLARTLDLAAVRWPQEAGHWPAIDAPLLRAILRGYEQVRPLQASERQALAVLIAASRIDLDASVLPLGTALEPEMAQWTWQAQWVRLSRAAAGAPELAEVLATAAD